MLEINNVDHINLTVQNLKKSSQFYAKLFDFKVVEEGMSSGRPYQIIGKNGQLFLCIYEGDKRPDGPINHIGINIRNFKEAEKILKDQGIALHYGGEIQYPNSRSLYIEDPDGNGIELSEVFGGGLDSSLK